MMKKIEDSETTEPELVAALDVRRILAKLFQLTRVYKTSEILFLCIISISQTMLRANHPNTLRCQEDLATQYLDLPQKMKAEKLYLRFIETIQSTRGPEHLKILSYQDELAILYRKSGRYA